MGAVYKNLHKGGSLNEERTVPLSFPSAAVPPSLTSAPPLVATTQTHPVTVNPKCRWHGSAYMVQHGFLYWNGTHSVTQLLTNKVNDQCVSHLLLHHALLLSMTETTNYKVSLHKVLSLNRLSVGCVTTPRRQSGDFAGFWKLSVWAAATSRILVNLAVFPFYKLQIFIFIYFLLI